MPIEGWFHTPIYYEFVEDFKNIQTELKNCVDQLHQEKLFRKNPHWHSQSQQLSNTFTENLIEKFKLELFRKELDQHITRYLRGTGRPESAMPKYQILSSWLTRTQKGEFSHRHNHGQADMSGVYYFQTNGHDGTINFHTPLTIMSHSYPFATRDVCGYYPEPGKILLFPGWLDHDVSENKTDSDRISMSFNIVFDRRQEWSC
jgi:uncharacterized protein (TIGR02466 family)